MKKDNLKILIVNYEFPPLGGGGGVATYDLAVEWIKHGQVDVLTSGFKGLPAYEKVNGINIHRARIFFRKSRDAATFISMLSYIFTGFIQGIRLCRKNRYDVINTHFAVPSGPLGYILAKLFSIPNVLSLHGGDIYDPSKKMSPHDSFIFSRVVRFILNRADRLIAQSTNTRDNTLSYYNPNKEVGIIPLAFHPPVKARVSRKSLRLENDVFYLITIGRLIKRKSIDTLLFALSEIKEKKIKLLIAGDGPEKDYLQGIVVDKGLEQRVSFLGYITEDDKYAYLSMSDLFVLTSLHEGFGIVFMEAMHAGLPVVATNYGGQTDLLKQNENAILINVGDVKACSSAIMKFVKDKNLYKKCSLNNKKRIRDYYADKVAMEYMKIFRELSRQEKQSEYRTNNQK
ncbi:MAG TPA: glycosyltransferase family 4 protein [Spirochaetota bacterium]|nr:glycosyltransferase family 4 protein [Spirochaetota bacterium]